MSFASQLANFSKTISNHNKNRNNQSNNHQRKRQRINNEEKLHSQLLDLSKSLPSTTPSERTHHIALLFLIIDELPFESIWESWINEGSGYSISILIHAKYPERVKSEFIKQHLILDSMDKDLSFRPEWGSIEITRAMIELIQYGLRIGEGEGDQQERYNYRTKENTASAGLIDRFIFISESCIPIQSLSTLAKVLYSNDKSWLNYRDTPNNGYSRQLQWDRIHSSIPRKFIHKSDQWIVLTRSHASLITRDLPRLVSEYSPKPIYSFFDTVKASDEMYFGTLLSMAGVDFENGVYRHCITYCDWEGMNNTKNPALFTTLQELRDVRKKVLDGGFFFGRKFRFKDRLGVEDWSSVVSGEGQKDCDLKDKATDDNDD